MRKLNADIKSRNFEKSYLLYGNEEYLKQSFRKQLFDAASGGDGMNAKVLSGKDQDLSALRDFTDTMPFFAERRVLLLVDTGLFKSASEGFDSWIRELPDTACVIFSESECDKRNRLFKAVSECGYVSELNHPDEETLERWIQAFFPKNGLRVTRDAYRKILEYSDDSMERLKNELEKLCSYCADKGTVTEEDVTAILTPAVKSRVFEMTESIALKDRDRALKLYYDLLSLKEPPLRILYLTARQFNQLLLVKELVSERKNRNEISELMKIRPFAAGKLSDLSRRFTVRELKDAVSLAAELEEAVKTGNLEDTLAAELLLIRLSGKS